MDTMISDIFTTPFEAAMLIAQAAKNKRLSLNLSQKSLSEKSGVSFGVIKKFERTGKISLESLLKLALVLGSLTEFTALFKQVLPEEKRTLDEILHNKRRKRGRK
jgi:transcriptional regulator with XRE-family HTH domain